jgi:alginate O-acetyltransferase complex protein AlgI
MDFISISYLLFLPVIFISFWSLKHKYRWMLIILSSLVFYSFAIPAYTILLILLTLSNYAFGLLIARTPEMYSKNIFITAISFNVLCLVFFKYAATIIATFLSILHGDVQITSSSLKIILPLGISFYTFTNISYLIEVKRNKNKFQVAE